MKKKLARVASIAFCLVGAHTAAASELGFYIGGQVGQSSKDVPRDFYETFNDDIQFFSFFEPTEEHNSFDESDTAFGLLGGYRFTQHLAIEGGYTRFGKVSYRSRASGNFPLEGGTLNTNIDSETRGFSFAALGALPLSRDWELFARGGVLFATTKIRVVIDATGTNFIPAPGDFDGSFTDDTTETFAAIGITRRVFEIYDIRFEYQRVFGAGAEDTGGSGDLDTALLGLNVTF
jgi:hypothetical protein